LFTTVESILVMIFTSKPAGILNMKLGGYDKEKNQIKDPTTNASVNCKWLANTFPSNNGRSEKLPIIGSTI
jgi:hypothetical protein